MKKNFYKVEALPTLILFYEGKVLERFIGYRSADVLEAEVRQVCIIAESSPFVMLLFANYHACNFICGLFRFYCFKAVVRIELV